MKRLALALFVLAALPALAADPATNAPAATNAWAEADLRGETFERWRFTILPGLDGRVDSTDTWKSFFGQLGVSWPRGSFVEPSGDDGFVVRNTRENLTTIRMALGALSVTVLQGEPVVLEDAPATNAPAAARARADDDGWPPLPAAVERLLEEFRTTGDCSSLDEAIWECKLAPVDSTAAALSNRIALVRRLVPFYDPDYDRKNSGPLYMHATPPKGYRTGTSPSAVSDPVERAAYEERIRVHHEQANARNVQHTLRGFFEDAAVFIEMIKPDDREEMLRQLPAVREVLDAHLAELASRGPEDLALGLCQDFASPARHGTALAWIAQAASALGSPDFHPPTDAPFLSDRDYVEALVAIGLAEFCESDWSDEASFEAILGLWWGAPPRSLRAHALARYAGQGNPAPGPRTLPAWRVGLPNRFEGDSPEARRAVLELARSLVVRSVFGERDIPSAAVVFGLFPEAGSRLAGIDRGDCLPRVAASAVPAIAERAPLVGRAIRRAEEAAEADAAGYPPVRHPPPGEVEGLFLLAAPDRDPPVFVAGEPIHFDVALSNAGPFVVSVEESTDWHEFRVDGLEPLEWRRPSPFPRGSELSRHFWWELFPGAVGRPDRIDLADWVSNAVPGRVSAMLRRNLELSGRHYAETRIEFEIVPAPAADPATNAPAATLAPAEVDAASEHDLSSCRPFVLGSTRPETGGSIPRGRPLRQQDPRTKRQKVAPHSPKAFGAENNPGHPSRSVQPLTSNPALP